MFTWILVVSFAMEWTEGLATRAYFTYSKYSWIKAQQQCKMIGSETTVNVSQSTVTTGWIDAVVTYTPWVDYLGCFGIMENQISRQKSVDSGEQLLQCLSYCNEYSYIGLQNSRCVCLLDASLYGRYINGTCDSKFCSGDTNALCSMDNDHYMFVIYNKVDLNIDGKGNCLMFTQNNQGYKYFFPSTCEQMLYQICSLDRSQTKLLQKDKRKLNWSQSFEDCQNGRNGLAPRSLVTESNLNPRNSYYWIGTIRRPSMSFLPTKDLGGYKYCLSAKVGINGQIESEINLCTYQLPALCTIPETTDPPSVTSGSHTVADESRDTKGKIADRKSAKINETLTITLISTSLVAFVVMIIIVALLVRFRRRRQRSHNQNVTIANKEVVYAKVNKPPKTAKKEYENSDTGSLEIYDHMNQYAKEDMIYATENNYDTMQSIENETENIYNHTNEGGTSCVICGDEEYSQVHLN